MTDIGSPSRSTQSDVSTIASGAQEEVMIDETAQTPMRINCVDAQKLILAVQSLNPISGGTLGDVSIRWKWTDRDGSTERTLDQSLGTGNGVYTADVPISEEATVLATEATAGAGDSIDVIVNVRVVKE